MARTGRPRTTPSKLPVLTLEECWVRQSGEPRDKHDCFTAYLHLGPGRSLPRAAVVSHPPVPLGTLLRWSAEWRWVERAAAWDRDRALVSDQRLAARHIESREMLAELLFPAVKRLADFAGKLDPRLMDARDLTTAVDKLSKLLLQATGGNPAPAVAVQVNTAVQVNGVPTAEQQLAAIMLAVERHPELRDVVQTALIGELAS